MRQFFLAIAFVVAFIAANPPAPAEAGAGKIFVEIAKVVVPLIIDQCTLDPPSPPSKD